MNKHYRLVIFDWEGTLGDTLGQILHCVAAEAKRLQLGDVDEKLARQYVDLGLVNAIRKLFPHLSAQQNNELLGGVQKSIACKHGDVYLIPGAKEVVEKLAQQGTNLAIATNKSHHSLQRALQQTGLNAFFTVTRSAGLLPPKPNPEMLHEILDEFSMQANDALMIGDSVNDMEMASYLNMDAIAVNFYNQQNDDNLFDAGALAVFRDYEAVASYLNLQIRIDV